MLRGSRGAIRISGKLPLPGSTRLWESSRRSYSTTWLPKLCATSRTMLSTTPFKAGMTGCSFTSKTCPAENCGPGNWGGMDHRTTMPTGFPISRVRLGPLPFVAIWPSAQQRRGRLVMPPTGLLIPQRPGQAAAKLFLDAFSVMACRLSTRSCLCRLSILRTTWSSTTRDSNLVAQWNIPPCMTGTRTVAKHRTQEWYLPILTLPPSRFSASTTGTSGRNSSSGHWTMSISAPGRPSIRSPWRKAMARP